MEQFVAQGAPCGDELAQRLSHAEEDEHCASVRSGADDLRTCEKLGVTLQDSLSGILAAEEKAVIFCQPQGLLGPDFPPIITDRHAHWA